MLVGEFRDSGGSGIFGNHFVSTDHGYPVAVVVACLQEYSESNWLILIIDPSRE